MICYKKDFISVNLLRIIKVLLVCGLSVPMITACSSTGGIVTKKAPPFSHIHIGHTLTGWRSTPDKQGLLTTAEEEADIVIASAQKAVSSNSLADKKQHISDALHAVDPKVQPTGAGKGYGLTRALVGSVSHLEYAATSDKASANVKETVPVIAKKAQQMASSSNQLKIFAQEALKATTDAEMDALLSEFVATAKKIRQGDQQNYGLVQFRQDVQAMADKERNPAYTTVDSYYLFNLIRLKSGKWIVSAKPRDPSVIDNDDY